MNKFFKKISEKRWFAYSIATCSAVALYMLLSKSNVIMDFLDSVLQFFNPILIGVIVAYLLNPLTMIFERLIEKKIKNEGLCHSLSVTVTILLILIVFVVAALMVIPYVVNNFIALGLRGNNYSALIDRMVRGVERFIDETGLDIDIDEIVRSIGNFFKGKVGLIPGGIAVAWETSMSVGSAMVNALISFIIAIYLLFDKKRILTAVNRLRHALLSENICRRDTLFFRHCNQVFIRYIGFSLVDALIIGVSNMCLMLIFDLPFIALLSVIVAVTNIVPTIGPMIGGLIGALILLVYHPPSALWFLMITLFLQTLDGYVIKPKLFGDTLGIPPVLTLIAIILGGRIWGIVGVFMSIPVMSVLCDLYSTELLPRLEARKKASSPH